MRRGATPQQIFQVRRFWKFPKQLHFYVPPKHEEEMNMATNVKQMMEAANAAVPRITPAQAKEMMEKGNTLVVDVRDAGEVEKSGKIAGAINVSRGMLEFRADPETPYHDKNFSK